MLKEYEKCNLCARGCGADRNAGVIGACRVPSAIYVSRIGLHMWEEPVISGTDGSGTVFFSGCSLGCAFCQNREISRGAVGKEISIEELSLEMVRLERQGAHNINLVTPTHYSPSVREAVRLSRGKGLSVPIVYNTGSYDTVEALRALEGTVDVYLPDMKYYRPETAKKLAGAENYPSVALSAIGEMVRQQPKPIIRNGIMVKGVIVRFLLLPGHVAEAKLALGKVFKTFGNSVYYSLMSQYTPMQGMTPPLDRRVTRAEYRELLEYSDRLGILHGFTQGEGAATDAYIPEFDLARLK